MLKRSVVKVEACEGEDKKEQQETKKGDATNEMIGSECGKKGLSL